MKDISYILVIFCLIGGLIYTTDKVVTLEQRHHQETTYLNARIDSLKQVDSVFVNDFKQVGRYMVAKQISYQDRIGQDFFVRYWRGEK